MYITGVAIVLGIHFACCKMLNDDNELGSYSLSEALPGTNAVCNNLPLAAYRFGALIYAVSLSWVKALAV